MSTHDRGFASMNRDKQREIASKGGKAAHAKGRAHEWTKDEAREAGRKGGVASQRAKHDETQEPSWPQPIVPGDPAPAIPHGTHTI